MDERSLQDSIAANPFASAATFTFDTTLMTKHLIGVDPDRKTDHPIRERLKGIYGVILQYIAVLETNLRDALHTYAHASGGSTPQLLADLAEIQELRETLLACLATHLAADIAPEYHVVQAAQKNLHIAKRWDAAATIPDDAENRDLTALLTIINRHFHDHCKTCLKGRYGKDGCRCARAGPTTAARAFMNRSSASSTNCEVTDPFALVNPATTPKTAPKKTRTRAALNLVEAQSRRRPTTLANRS